MEGVSGVVLAGGKSSRMGRNKAVLEVGGKRLVDRAAEAVGRVFSEVIIVANEPGLFDGLGLRVVPDLAQGKGPLMGIYTGLEAISSPWGFFVACDMPFLNLRLVEHMASHLPENDVVMPRIGDGLHPLHAYYAKTCTPTIRGMLEEGIFKIDRMLPLLRTRFVEEEEIRGVDPNLDSVRNINTPEELEEAERFARAAREREGGG